MRSPQRLLSFVALPAAVLVVIGAIALGWAVWSAQRTLGRSASLARTRQQMQFSLRVLDPAAAQADNPGFEPVASAAQYQVGTWFDGRLYLAGPAGLSLYGADGSLRRTLRTGLELPVAPISGMVAGRVRGAADAQLLIATRGAGLLLLDSDAKGTAVLHQLLPVDAGARDVTALLPLASGDLLLGTAHDGVLLFDGATLTPFAATAKQAVQITALAAVDSGSLLVGTRDAGLFYVHAGTVEHAEHMPDAQVESVLVDRGRAYAGTPLGVAEFDLAATGSVSFRPARTLAPGVFSHALAMAPDGSKLLVGTLDQGVREVALGVRARLRNVAFEAATERIDSFVGGSEVGGSTPYALADGALVETGTGGGHALLAGAGTSLSDRNISALVFAPDGSLYVGFFDHGLDVVSPGGAIRHWEDDHLFCVNRLGVDPERQTVTAATANGLVLFDREGTPRQVLTRRDGLISDHVTDVAYTRSGMTLATPAGLTFLGSTGAESLYAFQGLVNNHVYALGSGNGQLLAGTLGGLSVLESGAVKRNFTAANSGLKHNWITAIAPNPEGGWLIGTYGAGVETMAADGSRFTPVELPAGTPGDLVINPNAILATRSRVYVGTLGHGMLVLDSAARRWSVVTNGLPSLNVTAFAEREGQVYVGTENGLVRIAEARLP